MNLRELVAALETEKPQASESPVLVTTEEMGIYQVDKVEFEPDDGPDGTVWLWVKER